MSPGHSATNKGLLFKKTLTFIENLKLWHYRVLQALDFTLILQIENFLKPL